MVSLVGKSFTAKQEFILAITMLIKICKIKLSKFSKIIFSNPYYYTIGACLQIGSLE